MLAVILALLSLVLTLWILWRKMKFNFFKNNDIPGPEPSVFFGNLLDIYREGQHNCISKWIKQYGRVFGYYYGSLPVLVVADLDMIRIIQLKEFHKFANRPKIFEAASSRQSFNRFAITNARDKKWKDLRSIITPTFTTAKLKMMSGIVKMSVDELYDAVEKKSSEGKPFNIYSLYQNLTMDVICRTALGFHTNAQTNENEPFLRLTRMLLSFNMNLLFVFSFSFRELAHLNTFLRRLVFAWYNDGINPREELEGKTAAAIKLRRNDPNSRRKDLLQLMMDAQKIEDNDNVSSLTAEENDDKIKNASTKELSSTNEMKMSDLEILQNAVVFLIAGYETTSTALAFTTHFLMKYPEIQEKVRKEIKSNITDINDISYDVIHKLPYLDKVMNESLRLQPPITYFVNREAVEDVVIEDLRIPKGVAVQIPVYYLHHDPTIWENPEKFDPERFSPEQKANRHPMSFQAFGAGPRNCVGMRFAQMELKMALAKILYNFKFVGNAEDLEVSHSVAIDRPSKGVLVQVVKA